MDCPEAVCLPSGDAAIQFVRGGPNWPKNAMAVLGTALMRGTLVAGGLYAAGARGKQFAIYTAAATTAIEVGVLVWAFYVTRKQA